MTTVDEIKQAVKEALIEYEWNRNQGKLFTINQVAKRLGLHHSTVKKKVLAGLIKTTSDGLITERSINEYLKNT